MQQKRSRVKIIQTMFILVPGAEGSPLLVQDS